MINKYDELERLNDLLKKGILSEDEYNKGKNKLLNSPQNFISRDKFFGLNENTYNMCIHLSLLLGIVHPILGIVLPIVLWIINKDNYVSVNNNGKVVINWVLSLSIYIVCLFIFSIPFCIIGGLSMNFHFNYHNLGLNNLMSNIPDIFSFMFLSAAVSFILVVLNIVFIIVGGINASNGIIKNYPLTIKFLKLQN